MKQVIDFGAVKIQIASPDRILEWSHGEIKKPETINYRTLKPEKDGLFCERIFGPTKDWECYCGKYKRIRYKGIKCDKCGVEVTQSRVRRERMGHIKLAAPVAHVWFFKGAPSKLSLLLDISPRNLSSIMYFSQYIVLKVDENVRTEVLNRLIEEGELTQEQLKEEAKDHIEKLKVDLSEHIEQLVEKVKSKEIREIKAEELRLKVKQQIAGVKDNLDTQLSQTAEVYKTVREMVKRIKKSTIISEDEYIKLDEYGAVDHLEVGMGAESLLKLVKEMNLEEMSEKIKEDVKDVTGPRAVKLRKRLRVIEGFRRASISPDWMFLSVLPVLPPDLRPMVQLSGGRFATSDLNDLYRRVINRNNRLKHLIDLGAPEIILRNEKRMLQEAVDSLIDSTRARRTRRVSTQRQLRSLSEMLRGKQGRFRQNLLGKRVDYSGRSVIVVGPELNLNQCGLPKDMALEMFKPYVLRELIMQGLAPNVKSAKHALERRSPEVYDILDKVIEHHPVLLNRAPTLHKLGIQAFYPILIEGSAIRLHPCVCSGYNADFDGDQMAVHVPLTEESQEEVRQLMMPMHNFLKPADGSPITVPNKEMAMGAFYQTSIDERLEKVPTIFSNKDEAIHAFQTERIQQRQLIAVRLEIKGKVQIIETTVGRILFNEILPEFMRFINEAVTAGKIKEIVKDSIKLQTPQETADLIDAIKNMGFEAATLSGLSVAVTDCKMIVEKEVIIEGANKRAEVVQDNYNQGLITQDEKRRLTFDIWMKTTDEVAEKTWDSYSDHNAVKIMINSGGTRASKDQVKQLAAMRGLVVDPLGKIVEMPTKSNFREGLSIFEYVTSARGSRKGLTDSALKTADAGYLTRRLVDVSHDMIIRLIDCGTEEGLQIVRAGTREKSFGARITGRVAQRDVINEKTQEVLIPRGGLIEEEDVKKIVDAEVSAVFIRSPLACEAPYGLCATCYGWDFSTKKLVDIGMPAGVIAAQSIGEPGTQLTMRVKHSGGIVGLDVTQGLPRVEELFEARIPKALAPMAEIAGKVEIEETSAGHNIIVRSTSKSGEEREYFVPMGAQLLVNDGDLVHPGTQLIDGALDIKEVLAVRGLLATQEYLLSEIQKVYESQGISINDKHFEIIIRRMSDKVKVETTGDTHLLVGEIIDRSRFREINENILVEGGEPATAQVMIGGISRVALYTDSWFSAASFQHTTSVLTDAASSGAIDPLAGLKENVIIGRLIPTNSERASIE